MSLSQNDTGDGRLLILYFLAIIIISTPIISKKISAIANTGDLLYLNTKGADLYMTQDHHVIECSSASFEAAYPLLFQKIPINTASENLLETIPGVGKKTSLLIIEKRNQLNGITSERELEKIQGLGKHKTRNISKYITFE